LINLNKENDNERKDEFEFYARIRDENTIKYGTDVNRYGPIILSKMYSDRTHFLYELLQNTEDACERAAMSHHDEEFNVFFNLFPDRLEIWHNGIPFNEKDVKGICGLAAGTKVDDYSQIGKFGIGFKSVYAYTKSPKIYSSNKSGKSFFFIIEDFVHPHPIDKISHIRDVQTLIVIPFNHDTISQKIAYQEISKRLKNLGAKTLLFLNNLNKIYWKINNDGGEYNKEIQHEGKSKWIKLSYKDETNKESNEQWLVFDKTIDNSEHKAKVEVAFKIHQEEEEKRIVPAPYSTLYVYFDTGKETHLNFIVHGPYETTVGRDNILLSEWNEGLIDTTGVLLTEILAEIKKMSLLNVSFLETLPIDYEFFSQTQSDDFHFYKLYLIIKETLLGEIPFLPKYGGGFITAANALIGSTEEIRGILGKEQLESIYRGEDFNWMDASITRNRTPELRAYLMNILNIPELTPDMFARLYSEEFIEVQSDEWIINFYIFLNNQRALWKPRDRYINNPGILRSKPIIRLEDDTHTKPFDDEGEALAFLPTEGLALPFPSVKINIAGDRGAKAFLVNLNLKEPDRVASIKRHTIPKYFDPKVEVRIEDNIEDIKIIMDAINNIDKISERREFMDMIKQTPFILGRNILGESGYKQPTQIFIGREYNKNDDLDVFYSDNNEVWFLSNAYFNAISAKTFETFGCIIEIPVQYKNPDIQGYVWITRQYSNYQRGLNGFDPGCNIYGLENVLKTITFSKALILWKIISQYSHSLFGTYEKSTRQTFDTASSHKRYSKLGSKLVWYEWIPDRGGNFKEPSEIKLVDLPAEFLPNSSESKRIAEYLSFKKDITSELDELLPDEDREFITQAINWTEDERDIAIKAIEKLRFQQSKGPIDPEQLQEELIKEITKKPPYKTEEQEDKVWSRLDPEEEKDLRKNLGNEIPDRYEKLRLVYEERQIRQSTPIDSIDPKQFLLNEYRGRCQICNTQIDIGGGREPIINIYRLIEKRNINPAANMEFNILGLCPNCWTRLKYGYSDLRNIFEIAKKVTRDEIAPESIEEKMSDGYLIDISLIDKHRELFYSQTHMQAVANFLMSDFSNNK